MNQPVESRQMFTVEYPDGWHCYTCASVWTDGAGHVRLANSPHCELNAQRAFREHRKRVEAQGIGAGMSLFMGLATSMTDPADSFSV